MVDLPQAAECEATRGTEVLVPFEGEGTGVGRLSWGQLELWMVMEPKHTWLPIGTVRSLPAGTTVEDAVADLRFVMSHYPTMRTRLRLDPDGPEQVVSGSGEIRLEIVDAPEDADPAEVANQVWQRYAKRDYNFVTEWPVRMGVIRHRGALTHRAWVMCHLVTDGTGARVIIEELADRGSSGSGAAMTPLEQARWQRSPAGERHSEAALRYWERTLRSVPARRYPECTSRPPVRYRQAGFDSPAMHLAVRAISARTAVESPSVLLALFAVALARVTGINPVVVGLVVSNRFRTRLTRTVSPVFQPGIHVIDLPDGTVDEAVALTRRRAMTAYKYAYCDPHRRNELAARVERERGEDIDLECTFNDRRLTPRDESGPAPTPEQIRAALPRSTLRWDPPEEDRPVPKLYVYVDDVPDTVAMTVLADFHHLPQADVEACLRGMEEVAVAAALDPATRTRVVGGGHRRWVA